MPARRGLLLLALLGVMGCGRPLETVERERVLAAVDRVRDASSVDVAHRRKLLEALAAEPAVAPAAKLARDRCASAYGELFDGNDLRAQIQAALKLGGALPEDVPAKLREAETHIARAKAIMPDCERALADLRHSLRQPPAARPVGHEGRDGDGG